MAAIVIKIGAARDFSGPAGAGQSGYVLQYDGAGHFALTSARAALGYTPLDAAGSVGGTGTQTWTLNTTTTDGLRLQVTGDTSPRLAARADGQLAWGPGNAAGDIWILRPAAQNLYIQTAVSTTARFQFQLSNVNPTLFLCGDATNGFSPSVDFRPANNSTLGGAIASNSISGGLSIVGRGAGGALRIQGSASNPNLLYTLALIRVASQTGDIMRCYDSDGATVLYRINKDGYQVVKKTSAPADADLNASEVCMWLDNTTGATKVNFKAKDSTGAVRTASIPLA